MMTVIIEDFFGRRVGSIVRNQDGSLAIRSEDADLEEALRGLLVELIQKPLRLREGYTDLNSPGIVGTRVRVCQPDDSDYMLALADAIAAEGLEIAGTRLRGYVVGPRPSRR